MHIKISKDLAQAMLTFYDKIKRYNLKYQKAPSQIEATEVEQEEKVCSEGTNKHKNLESQV